MINDVKAGVGLRHGDPNRVWGEGALYASYDVVTRCGSFSSSLYTMLANPDHVAAETDEVYTYRWTPAIIRVPANASLLGGLPVEFQVGIPEQCEFGASTHLSVQALRGVRDEGWFALVSQPETETRVANLRTKVGVLLAAGEIGSAMWDFSEQFRDWDMVDGVWVPPGSNGV